MILPCTEEISIEEDDSNFYFKELRGDFPDVIGNVILESYT